MSEILWAVSSLFAAICACLWLLGAVIGYLGLGRARVSQAQTSRKFTSIRKNKKNKKKKEEEIERYTKGPLVPRMLATAT